MITSYPEEVPYCTPTFALCVLGTAPKHRLYDLQPCALESDHWIAFVVKFLRGPSLHVGIFVMKSPPRVNRLARRRRFV